MFSLYVLSNGIISHLDFTIHLHDTLLTTVFSPLFPPSSTLKSTLIHFCCIGLSLSQYF